MSKVDVFLSSYNRPKMLARATKSVLTQKNADFRLYILDDNSNEDTKAIVRAFEADNPGLVTAIFSDVRDEDRKKSVRYAVMINMALGLSNGDYITYLTDDCWYLPRRLERMSDYLDKNPSVYAVYGNQMLINTPDNVRIATQVVQTYNGVSYSIGSLIRGNYRQIRTVLNVLDHNQVMHRRSVIDKIGLWDTEMDKNASCKDGIFFQRIADTFGPFHPINATTDAFLFHDQSYTEKMKRGEELY